MSASSVSLNTAEYQRVYNSHGVLIMQALEIPVKNELTYSEAITSAALFHPKVQSMSTADA